MHAARHHRASQRVLDEPAPMPIPRTDTVLLKQAAAGDQAAFAALYDRLAPMVHGLACQMLRDPTAAETVTYEVFVDIWKTAPTFDPTEGTAEAWTLRLACARIAEQLTPSTRQARALMP